MTDPVTLSSPAGSTCAACELSLRPSDVPADKRKLPVAKGGFTKGRQQQAASTKRVRRSPEAARELILEAAARVFAERGPAKTQLKAVAAAAGVSHALVTHYFGTVDALVEQVIERHMSKLREDVLVAIGQGGTTEAVLGRAFAALTDPLQTRLMAWTLLSGGPVAEAFFPHRALGLRKVVDQVTQNAGTSFGSREELENQLVFIWCAIAGYGAGASTIWKNLGLERDKQRDAAFLKLLSRALETWGTSLR